MTPIEAALLAAELTNHMDRLSALDLHPFTSAADIELHRQEALDCAQRLSAYLIASENFGGL